MIITVIAILLGLSIFLLVIHVLCRDDFVLFRRNISLEQIFDLAFITSAISLFSARLFFVIFHFKPGYLNPLVFFHIFHYPGLSLTGAAIGGLLFLLIFLRNRKYPTARMFDIISLGFLYAISLSTLIMLVSYPRGLISVVTIIGSVVYFISAVLLTQIFLQPKTREGTITAASFVIFAMVGVIRFGLINKISLSYAGIEFVVLLFLLLISVLLLVLRVTKK